MIAKANFAPDKDSVSVTTLPACHWPYVVTPCTFLKGLVGKFEITLLMDKEALEFVELSKDNIAINPAEVVCIHHTLFVKGKQKEEKKKMKGEKIVLRWY